MNNGERAFTHFQLNDDSPAATGEWALIDQARIDAFAEVTEDRQFIHVDPHLSAEQSPYGTTVAHGFLTLSMLTVLTSTIPVAPERTRGMVMGINYGFEKVRFISPVKVDSRIRAATSLTHVELKDPNTIQSTQTVTVEIAGQDKPALVAEWTTRYLYS